MSLHTKYASQLAHHPFGHALYHPKTSEEIRPGLCGYFDHHGHWQPIVDLTSPKDLESKKFSAIALPPRAPKAPYMEWGPFCSNNVHSQQIGTAVGVSGDTIGAPVGASIHFEFSTGSDTGAVLLTEAPIEQDSFYRRQTFLDWCKKNQSHLIKYAPEIANTDLWIVTGVHTTPRCSLTVAVSKERKVKVGFGLEAAVAGKLEFCKGWEIKTSDSGWIHAGKKPGTSIKTSSSSTSTADTKYDDDKVVVFVSGLHFRFKPKAYFRKPHFNESQEKRGFLDTVLDMPSVPRATVIAGLTMATVGLIWMGMYFRYAAPLKQPGTPPTSLSPPEETMRRKIKTQPKLVRSPLAPRTPPATSDAEKAEPFELAFPDSLQDTARRADRERFKDFEEAPVSLDTPSIPRDTGFSQQQTHLSLPIRPVRFGSGTSSISNQRVRESISHQQGKNYRRTMDLGVYAWPSKNRTKCDPSHPGPRKPYQERQIERDNDDEDHDGNRKPAKHQRHESMQREVAFKSQAKNCAPEDSKKDEGARMECQPRRRGRPIAGIDEGSLDLRLAALEEEIQETRKRIAALEADEVETKDGTFFWPSQDISLPGDTTVGEAEMMEGSDDFDSDFSDLHGGKARPSPQYESQRQSGFFRRRGRSWFDSRRSPLEFSPVYMYEQRELTSANLTEPFTGDYTTIYPGPHSVPSSKGSEGVDTPQEGTKEALYRDTQVPSLKSPALSASVDTEVILSPVCLEQAPYTMVEQDYREMRIGYTPQQASEVDHGNNEYQMKHSGYSTDPSERADLETYCDLGSIEGIVAAENTDDGIGGVHWDAPLSWGIRSSVSSNLEDNSSTTAVIGDEDSADDLQHHYHDSTQETPQLGESDSVRVSVDEGSASKRTYRAARGSSPREEVRVPQVILHQRQSREDASPDRMSQIRTRSVNVYQSQFESPRFPLRRPLRDAGRMRLNPITLRIERSHEPVDFLFTEEYVPPTRLPYAPEFTFPAYGSVPEAPMVSDLPEVRPGSFRPNRPVAQATSAETQVTADGVVEARPNNEATSQKLAEKPEDEKDLEPLYSESFLARLREINEEHQRYCTIRDENDSKLTPSEARLARLEQMQNQWSRTKYEREYTHPPTNSVRRPVYVDDSPRRMSVNALLSSHTSLDPTTAQQRPAAEYLTSQGPHAFPSTTQSSTETPHHSGQHPITSESADGSSEYICIPDSRTMYFATGVAGSALFGSGPSRSTLTLSPPPAPTARYGKLESPIAPSRTSFPFRSAREDDSEESTPPGSPIEWDGDSGAETEYDMEVEFVGDEVGGPDTLVGEVSEGKWAHGGDWRDMESFRKVERDGEALGSLMVDNMDVD